MLHFSGLRPGTVLENRYRILNLVGRGGMGSVYKALDARLQDSPVAIKEMIVTVDSGTLQDRIKSFEREATMLINLRHHALPRIIDFFAMPRNRWYLVMDFIEGRTLEDVAQTKAPLAESLVLKWAEELCDVLEYLHSQRPPVIFRDLKPANIMITNTGELRLIDFGIARHFNQDTTKDTTYGVSAGFSPPEQYGMRQTDIQSDVYALGATLHYLLTGISPANQPFNFSPPKDYANISEAVNDAVMHAVEIKPENRPSSISEFRLLLKGERRREWNDTGVVAPYGTVFLEKKEQRISKKLGRALLDKVLVLLPAWVGCLLYFFGLRFYEGIHAQVGQGFGVFAGYDLLYSRWAIIVLAIAGACFFLKNGIIKALLSLIITVSLFCYTLKPLFIFGLNPIAYNLILRYSLPLIAIPLGFSFLCLKLIHLANKPYILRVLASVLVPVLVFGIMGGGTKVVLWPTRIRYIQQQENAIDTAIAVSRCGWSQARTVVLVNEDNYVEALVSVPLAYEHNAPILLLPSEGENIEAIVSEIKRLKAKKIIWIGAQDGHISQFQDFKIEFIGGSDLFETASIIARFPAKKIFLVNGDGIDGLAAAPYAGKYQYPILLTDSKQLSPYTISALEKLRPEEIIILGDERAVEDGILDPIQYRIHRISAENHYETAKALVQQMYPGSGYTLIMGQPSAAVASALVYAAKLNHGVLLLQDDTVSEQEIKFIRDLGPKSLMLLGLNSNSRNEMSKLLDLIIKFK